MRNFILRYGLLGGSVSITLGLINWFTIAQIFGPLASQTVGWLTVVVALMCVPLGIKYYRDKLNKGYVSFGEGFKIGLGIVTIFGIMTYFYTMLFFVFAGESFDQWNKSELTTVELSAYEAQIASTPAYVFTPWFQALILCVSVFIIGLIVNLVSTILLKRP